ncbi:MAG: NADH-quinone oxidoreductase subunit L [Sandaracinaceae bacterium]
MSFDVQSILLPIILLPIFGALINGLTGYRAEKQVVTLVAVGSVALAFVLSTIGFGFLVSQGHDGTQVLTHDVYEWFSISVGGLDVPIRVRFVMDHLSGIMTVMVTGIGTLIHVYSIGYMKEDPGYWRFMTYLNLFMASMLILVLASSLPLMFVGWEGVGLCSYLLIGFWYENEDYAKAGRKAFVVNRIGDFGVLIGMFLLVAAVASMGSPEAFEFTEINDVAGRLGTRELTYGANQLGFSVATGAVLFLFLGCTGKSAQLPLFVWLPDAMAGPTPVSALIHAATMVTAGVYLLVRLSPVVVVSPFAMSVIAIIGTLTALIAASVALVQNQMKKILAYSTVSQLGFMFAAVGMGAFAGGFFHVFTHAFFKACLFLGAGSVMHAIHAHGDADIRYLGNLRKYMPKTHITFAIATAAIAGLPLLSGFFSKDEILLGAMAWATAPSELSGSEFGYAQWVGWFVFVGLTIAATMTAFYMFRLYFRTFWGEYKGGHPPGEHAHDGHADDEHGHDEDGHDGHDHGPVIPHESELPMTIPLMVLAAGAALVGYLGMPHLFHLPNWWADWLTPQGHAFSEALATAVGSGAAEDVAIRAATQAAREVSSGVAILQYNGQMWHAPSWAAALAMGVGTAAAVGGAGLAFFFYKVQDGEIPGRIMKSVAPLHRFLMDKWRIDEFYGVIIVSPMNQLGVFAANLDRYFVDTLLTKVSSGAMRGLGFLVTRTQTGVIYAYAGLFVLGLAGLGWWFTYPHADVEYEATVGEVTWTASSGLGYEYRWDFDSNGEFDTEWSAEATSTHNYRGAAYFGLVGIIEGSRDPLSTENLEIVVAPGDDPESIPSDVLGPGWSAEPGAIPPSIAYEDDQLVVRINGANIPDRDGPEDGRVALRPGQTLSLGSGLTLVVGVRVRSKLEVRNGFGNLSSHTEEITLRVARPTAANATASAHPTPSNGVLPTDSVLPGAGR